jgi:beta-phosphoglucomutase-like phosphatase (HAD superfamily)
VFFQLPEGDFDGIIYDCDGTLADSMPLHHRAWRQAFVEVGARFDFHWELFTSRAGMGLVETVLELNRQFGEELDPLRTVAAQRTHFSALLSDITPVESVVAHARQYAGRLPQCVASGGERPVVERELSVLGIRELFSFVVCHDEVSRGKPDPEMFLLCAARMGIEPARCLVFEDGAFGIQAAQAAGMAWVYVDGSGRCGVAGK